MRPEHWIYTIPLRLRSLFRRRQADQELDEELQYHVELKTSANIAKGMTPREARRAALLEMGGVEKRKEECRDTRRVNWLQDLLQDLRYGLRMLRKSPGFTAVAVLTLALGIGANTAIFSVTYGILLKPLPYPDSSRLVQLWETTAPPGPGRTVYISSRDFREIASQCRAFEHLAGYVEGGSTITGLGGPEGVQASYVSGNFFSVLGAQPLLGRPILPADAEPGHDQVAVLTYDLWQRRYGGDPGIIGKEITLTDEDEGENSSENTSKVSPYTIIGVMPSRFPFPNHGDLLLPQASWDRQHQLIAIGRLKREISIGAANAELHTIAARIGTEAPAGHRNFDLSVGLLRDRMSEGYITEFLILLGAVTFVLLLACVNTSSLLIARSWVRQKEVMIREILGATRWRLIRQFLSESVLLAFLGAALGLLFAYWGIDLLRSMAPPSTPRLDEVNIDRLVLAYTLGISILAGILFGLAPAMQFTRPGRDETSKKGSPGSLGRLSLRRPQRLKNLLVIGEISLAFVLVAGSTLVLRSFSNLMDVKLGFRPAHILTMNVNFSPAIRANPEWFKLAMDEVLQRTHALPGIENTAFGEWLPVGGTSFEGSVRVDGKGDSEFVEYQLASPEYFATLGIPLLAGRSFSERDTNEFTPFPRQPNTSSPAPSASPHPESRSSSAVHSTKGTHEGTPLVAIVNETLAKRYFEGNPLGKEFRTSDPGGSPVQVQIVGEVGDTRDVSRALPPIAEYYIPFAQVEVSPETTLFVRTAANPMAMANAVREQVWMVDKDAPIGDVMTMNAVMSESVVEPRFQTALLSTFGVLGLLLAVVGVYGLVSYGMVQRTHEIGVRMALGAHPHDILRMLIREGTTLAAAGIVIGIGGALALTRFLASLLFEIRPTDPLTFAGVATLLILVALAACYIPARRAMRVDPMVALRYE
ncbi:MAG: ABC transporter permease [Candidatus Acidiferrales bacterium]